MRVTHIYVVLTPGLNTIHIVVQYITYSQVKALDTTESIIQTSYGRPLLTLVQAVMWQAVSSDACTWGGRRQERCAEMEEPLFPFL